MRCFSQKKNFPCRSLFMSEKTKENTFPLNKNTFIPEKQDLDVK